MKRIHLFFAAAAAAAVFTGCQQQEADFDRINSTTAPTQPEPETEAQNQWTDNGYDYNSGYDDGSQWQNDNGYDNGGGYSDNSGDYGNYDGATQQW